MYTGCNPGKPRWKSESIRQSKEVSRMRGSRRLFATPMMVIALIAMLCVPAQAQRGSTYSFQKISSLGGSVASSTTMIDLG